MNSKNYSVSDSFRRDSTRSTSSSRNQIFNSKKQQNRDNYCLQTDMLYTSKIQQQIENQYDLPQGGGQGGGGQIGLLKSIQNNIENEVNLNISFTKSPRSYSIIKIQNQIDIATSKHTMHKQIDSWGGHTMNENIQIIFFGIIIILIFNLISLCTYLTQRQTIQNILLERPYISIIQFINCSGVLGWYMFSSFISFLCGIIIMIIVFSEIINQRQKYLTEWIRFYKNMCIFCLSTVSAVIVIAKLEEQLYYECNVVYDKYLWIYFWCILILTSSSIFYFWIRKNKMKLFNRTLG